MIVLDTNVLSELLRSSPDPMVVRWMRELKQETATTVVTVAELLAGIARMPDGKRKGMLTAQVKAVIDEFDRRGKVLAFDVEAASEYADIVARRMNTGIPISTADAQIASICAVHGAHYATRNIKDFAHTGITVINPWEGPTFS